MEVDNLSNKILENLEISGRFLDRIERANLLMAYGRDRRRILQNVGKEMSLSETDFKTTLETDMKNFWCRLNNFFEEQNKPVEILPPDMAKITIEEPSLKPVNQIEPPQSLLNLAQVFVPKDLQEFALGDIEERFESDVEKSGERTAKLNLCKNILSSICPFVWGFVRARFDKLVGRVEK